MSRSNGRLDLKDYLLNPNHYSIQSWYSSYDGNFEEILKIDFEEKWKNFCTNKGIFPFDDNITVEIYDQFFDEYIERDKWLVIPGSDAYKWTFELRYVFISILINEMEISEEEKNEAFECITSTGSLYFCFHEFPRRMDLFPLRNYLAALQLYNNLSKAEKSILEFIY